MHELAGMTLPGESSAVRLAMLSMRNAIDTLGKKSLKWRVGLQLEPYPYMGEQMLPFEGQSCSHGE
jgi:hypothetical protein